MGSPAKEGELVPVTPGSAWWLRLLLLLQHRIIPVMCRAEFDAHTCLCPAAGWRSCFIPKQQGSDLRWKSQAQRPQISVSTFTGLWVNCLSVAGTFVGENKSRMSGPPANLIFPPCWHWAHSQCFQCKRLALKGRPLTLLCNAVSPGSCVLLKAFAFKGEKEQTEMPCGVKAKK